MIYMFDFDGTLVDSMPYWSRKVLNVLDFHKVSYPDDIIKTLATLGDMGAIRYMKENFGISQSEEEILAMMDEYAMPKYRDEIGFKDDSVPRYLNRLKKEGHTLCVLTASPHKMLDPCLKRLGIYDIFDYVWSCDDFGTTKSNPQIYLDSIKKAGGSGCEPIIFDDNAGACKTAKSAGLTVVGVYDKSGEDFTEEIKSATDKYIITFDEM